MIMLLLASESLICIKLRNYGSPNKGLSTTAVFMKRMVSKRILSVRNAQNT
jgi:hypothetical protein